MPQVYLELLILICTSLLLRGIFYREKIYEFPTLMGYIFLSFISPQAFSLLKNPGVVAVESVEKVLLMTIMCLVMCYLGYKIPIGLSKPHEFDHKANDDKLLLSGLFLSSIGLASVIFSSNNCCPGCL
ncbi:hypothetical protein HRE53_01055 [Acaryochloris sp. 'Moss Beach']|uniref:hypothetical protein n=1 Tax=Acaryochloris sp. 'Moss Beach' TaxID=2740837 RepID=UPI001F4695C0|nr:hypothetical protein [Acaryochloris sp. 'Moss Beach']UJB69820.1 hypothetical protein HRE53_01055 [Acaryochloris sp. 'Moss Beach']